MSTKKTSISSTEARERLQALAKPFQLGHDYARVQRATVLPDGQRETDGEHALSLAVIATAYATKYHPDLDPYKVFFYAVMHDVDEFKHGDTPTLRVTEEAYAAKDAQEADAAIERNNILKDFPVFVSMLEGMADLAVAENAFGKAFDKLAPLYTHMTNRGQVLRDEFDIHSYEQLLEATSTVDKKLLVYAAEFVDLLAMRQEAHKMVAEASFDTSTP